jgi:hypothetical protein
VNWIGGDIRRESSTQHSSVAYSHTVLELCLSEEQGVDGVGEAERVESCEDRRLGGGGGVGGVRRVRGVGRVRLATEHRSAVCCHIALHYPALLSARTLVSDHALDGSGLL